MQYRAKARKRLCRLPDMTVNASNQRNKLLNARASRAKCGADAPNPSPLPLAASDICLSEPETFASKSLIVDLT